MNHKPSTHSRIASFEFVQRRRYALNEVLMDFLHSWRHLDIQLNDVRFPTSEGLLYLFVKPDIIGKGENISSSPQTLVIYECSEDAIRSKPT